ncbi:MAG: DUF1501 domain-containing protein [Deltaproteobacteria bacterium]
MAVNGLALCDRREFLRWSAAGMATVCGAYGGARAAGATDEPHDAFQEGNLPCVRAARADAVIWLCMLGGVSHLESFDPKPALNKYAGKTFSATPFDVLNQRFTNKNIDNMGSKEGPKHESHILPLQVGFQKQGESGIEVSDWWPCVGRRIDDIAVVRSLWTTDFQHSAQAQFHTGRPVRMSRPPSVGAWVRYAAGSRSSRLPGFIVLGQPPSDFGGGRTAHEASYLGPSYAGVRLSSSPTSALPFSPPDSRLYAQAQRNEFELLRQMNTLTAQGEPNDSSRKARSRAYELAYSMQESYPRVLDMSDETPETQQLYGLDEPVTEPFGRQCLVARRLVEQGVRFIQIYHGGNPNNDNGDWDAHQNVRENHGRMCPRVDKPIAGLLQDLKRRGMLERTLVVWGSEFGRAPNVDFRTPCGGPDFSKRMGRDHHVFGFSCWFAGGGVKGGVVHGRTDELGFHAVEDRHYVTDVHATIYHLLGLPHDRMKIEGRQRLPDDLGTPIHGILA